MKYGVTINGRLVAKCDTAANAKEVAKQLGGTPVVNKGIENAKRKGVSQDYDMALKRVKQGMLLIQDAKRLWIASTGKSGSEVVKWLDVVLGVLGKIR